MDRLHHSSGKLTTESITKNICKCVSNVSIDIN